MATMSKSMTTAVDLKQNNQILVHTDNLKGYHGTEISPEIFRGARGACSAVSEVSNTPALFTHQSHSSGQ